MFNYDWFHGTPFKQQCTEARRRCALQRFPDLPDGDIDARPEARKFYDELEERTLIYLRDGFSYEIRNIAEVSSKSHFVFECVPVDEQYRVGTFVVTVPFDEIVRVEVFAVHPAEKPADMPQITGFRGFSETEGPKPPPTPKPSR